MAIGIRSERRERLGFRISNNNHVHVFSSLSKNIAFSDLIGRLKGASSKRLKEKGSMALGGRMDTAPSPSASPTWNRSRPISSTRQSIIRNLATRKRFAKFSNATGSPSTNAMFGIETPKGRTPLQGASLDVTSPRAKAPGLFCLTAPRS